jgi:DNA polymerase
MNSNFLKYGLLSMVFDVETRSEIDLRKTNPYVYAKHPSTEVLCLAFKLVDTAGNTTKTFLLDKEQVKTPIFTHWGGLTFLWAHNAYFERMVWEHILVERYGWPKVPLENWRCSAAQARAQALPGSLDGACSAAGLDIKKDMVGHKLMLKMCKPRKPTKTNKDKYHFTEKDYKRLCAYCIKDVDAEHALIDLLPPLTPELQEQWFMDQRINDRGVCVNVKAIKAAIDILGDADIKAKERLSEITGGFITSPGQVARIKEYCGDHGVDIPNTQADTLKKVLG